MIYNKDQAENLRVLAQRKRIFFNKGLDTFDSLLGHAGLPRNSRAVFTLIRNLFIITCVVLIAAFFVLNYKKYNTAIELLNIEKENQKEKVFLLTTKISGLENQLSRNISYNQELTKQLEDLRLLKNELQNKQEEANRGLEFAMQDKIKDLQIKINQLESNLKEVNLSIQNNSFKENTRLNREGKILFINLSQEFVVISLGGSDGIDKGSRLGVIKNDKIIVELKTVEVRRNISACDIIKGQLNNSNIGDKIKLIR